MVSGEVLLVSQFTLFYRYKGTNLDFSKAMPPEPAQEFYDVFHFFKKFPFFPFFHWFFLFWPTPPFFFVKAIPPEPAQTFCTAYCMWSVISSIPNLNPCSSSLGLFCHAPLKRDQ